MFANLDRNRVQVVSRFALILTTALTSCLEIFGKKTIVNRVNHATKMTKTNMTFQFVEINNFLVDVSKFVAV